MGWHREPTADEHRGQALRAWAVLSQRHQPEHHPHPVGLSQLQGQSPPQQRGHPGTEQIQPSRDQPTRGFLRRGWFLGRGRPKPALPLPPGATVWQEWPPWAQACFLWGLWPLPHSLRKPFPPGLLDRDRAPRIAVGCTAVLPSSTGNRAKPPSQSKHGPRRPATTPRPPRLPHMGLEGPGPSLLTGASVDPCLPAPTLSRVRHLLFSPCGQWACPCHLPRLLVPPQSALLPQRQPAPGPLRPASGEPPDPGSRGHRSLLVTWAGQGASELPPGPGGGRPSGSRPSGQQPSSVGL